MVIPAILIFVLVATTLFLILSMVRSIQNEMRRSGVRRIWKNFALSIVFCVLFLSTWAAHGLAEWQVYTHEQSTHREPVRILEFIEEFSQSTLENWQSEFLQLFSFVVMAALYLHRGSAESRDSDDRMEEALKRIEKRLDDLQPENR
jgi:type III secretory pathway component EscR